MSDFKGVLKNVAAGGVGFVGVNVVHYLADKLGLSKFKEGKDANTVALISAAVRFLAIPLVAKLGSRFLKMDAKSIAVGGALNLGLHGARDLMAAQPTLVPPEYQSLLLGYDGTGDFITAPYGVGDYLRLNGVGFTPGIDSTADLDPIYG